MTHNEIDIDQYLLLIIYPSIVLFSAGYVSKKMGIKVHFRYLTEAIICISFAIIYYLFLSNGGANGLVLVLLLIGIFLLYMTKKKYVHNEDDMKTQL
ncbi:MAG: hypothetical protein DA328_02515 [Nitrososphaeraceae archaeon]|nr:hypothetical protein [Nitrososphaeraceae archaeon]